MTKDGTSPSAERWPSRAVLWLLAAAGLALFMGANAHLLFVAITSQPDCVAHVKTGEAQAAGRFSAAQSACSPR